MSNTLPPYNVGNRKVVHFDDFISNINAEKDELKSVRRGFKKNDTEDQMIPGSSKYKWNKVTRKMDDLSQQLVDDKIDAIDDLEVKESMIVEGRKTDFLEWLKDLKEDIEEKASKHNLADNPEDDSADVAYASGREELIQKIYKKAKKILNENKH